MIGPERKTIPLSVLDIRHLTPSAYVLRIDRGTLEFRAGQYISLGIDPGREMREYSIYSGEQDDYLEVLIREVEQGSVSRQLKQLSAGKRIHMAGPFGFFTLSPEIIRDKNILMVASGTGIAPFHSFTRSYPGLNYRIIHGVRYGNESYERESYDQERYILCTSRDGSGHFHGRVTSYLEQNPIQIETDFDLCGNRNMVHDMYDLLTGQGIMQGNIHAEIYF
jgi:ferredoxin--NADP+ reductase/benzoate/toluate 1,2-dioxygenase reductase subunit